MNYIKALLFITTTLISTQLFAHNDEANQNITPYNDAKESIQGYRVQHLKNHPAWQNFIGQNPTWGARFNRYTKLPHRAVGNPISFGSSQQDLVGKSIDFINSQLSEFSIPTNKLISTRNHNDGKYINVDFVQYHNGMEILWSNVAFRYSQKKEIIMFGLDVHTTIPNSLPQTITAVQAQSAAENALSTPILNSTVNGAKKIIPIPVNGNYEYHVVYEVITETQDTKEMPGKYVSYVDAETAKIWYRDNKVHQIGFTVDADLHRTNLFTASQLTALPHLRAVSGSNTYYSDAAGVFNIPGTTFTGAIHLDGRYCDIVTGQNGTVSPSVSPTGITNNGTYTYPVSTPQPQIQHFSTYYNVNVVHDFMKSKLPTFTSMDNPLRTRIDRTDGDCNAFYNGSSINFYTTANGCNAFSLINTVVYHEYGHGISNQFYNSQGTFFSNGGLGEGYSDIWAFFIEDDPIVGRGRVINSPNSFVRRYDVNPKVYPQDLVGQVHADGEIIAGAWWDTYQYWGSLDSVSSLFAQSLYGVANGPNGTEGEVYFDVLIDALQYDDNDNNISNGTPHFNFIVQGFADHGIYLLNNTEIIHADLLNQNSGSPINVHAEAKTDFTPFLGDLTLRYRMRGTSAPSLSLLMTKTNEEYDVVFPSQTAGDSYEYYFELSDNTNSYSVVSPKNSGPTVSFFERNLPYFVLIGYVPKYQEFFDGANAPNGWTIGNAPGDGAIRGIWEQATPIPSFENSSDSSTIVQTYFDYNGGGKCLVTGNASSPTASIGQADVDGGRTTVISPAIDLSGYTKPYLGYSRWFSNSQGSNPRKDRWVTELSYNGGSSWIPMERSFEPDVRWRRFTYPLTPGNHQVMVRFVANDSAQAGMGGSLVEAAVDVFQIYDLGETPVSVNSIDKLNFSIYPNPVRQALNVVLPTTDVATVEILSSVGQVLLSEDFKGGARLQTINTTELSSGLYYVRVYQNGKMNTKKFVVSK